MESPFKVFVVEDDIWYANFLAQHIQNRHPDFEVLRFENAADCLENLESLRPDIMRWSSCFDNFCVKLNYLLVAEESYSGIFQSHLKL